MPMRIQIHLIDVVSIWISIMSFIMLNRAIEFVSTSNVMVIDPIFYIGFTNKAAVISIIVGPIFFFVMRLFKRTSIWDLFIGVLAVATFAIALRLGSCNLKLFDDHVYASGFDPSLDHRTQCAYFALLNFVITLPKMMALVLVLGLMRSFLYRIFGLQNSA